MHELVLPVQEVRHRMVRQAPRRTFADHAPDPATLLQRELGLPAQLVHLQRSLGRVLHGQPDQRQRDKFLGARQQGSQFFVQVTRRAAVNRIDPGCPLRVEQAGRLHGDARTVVFHAQARTYPGDMGFEFAGLELLFRRRGAAVVGFALGQPEFLDLRGHLGATGVKVGQQCITAHCAVVLHAELRVFGREGCPVPDLPQKQQPVITQPVLLVGARVALQEIAYFLVAGRFQPRAQFPISRPRFERVAAHLGQQCCEALAVAFLVRVGHFQDRVVGLGGFPGLRHRSGGRPGTQRGDHGERCQNG